MGKHSGRLELTWTDKEKSLLSSGDGKYDYTFVDPSDYRVSEVRLLYEVDRIDAPTHAKSPNGLPVPTTENLLITGDAMHVLDALARSPEYAEEYLGKVKLVYIDPPFNTGQAFVNYEDNVEHSIWLTMLRDRLRQIRPLLAEEGSIWVHLDDVEVHRCRAVMDEEFGSNGFITQITWQKRTTRENRAAFSESHDTILVYSRMARARWRHVRNRLPRTDRASNPDGDPRGPWESIPFTAQGSRDNQMYQVTTPTGVVHSPPRGRCWGATLPEYERLQADNRIYFPKGGDGRPRVKQFAFEAKGLVPHTIWLSSEVDDNDRAKKEVLALFSDQDAFDTPKPERLLQRIVHIATDPGDIVLDCFAGSGTTAAVAHKMGRRWVTSELLPETVEKFTKPRLSKVVANEDPGGITTTTVRAPVAGTSLPEGVSADDAQRFQTSLGRVLASEIGDDMSEAEAGSLVVDLVKELTKNVRASVKAGISPASPDEVRALMVLLKKVCEDRSVTTLDVTPQVKHQLRKRTMTRDETTINWHGGGGFTHLRVGPSMFEEVEGLVFLADWATNGELTRAMCAQLGVRHQPDGIFAGRKGRTRLVVIDGMAGASTIDSIVDQLTVGENVEIWATQIDDEATDRLGSVRPSSRIRRIPDAVLDSYRRNRTTRLPFGSGSGNATTRAEGIGD